jgi:hypothetical protein
LHTKGVDPLTEAAEFMLGSVPLVSEQQREPLYSAEEMRAAEAAYPGPTLELMERAGARVAKELLRAYPGAQRIAVWCRTGANGADGLAAADAKPDVVLDSIADVPDFLRESA